MTAKDLLNEPLFWKQHKELHYYFTYFNDIPLLLRMNDFPDEPLFTFIYLLEIVDLEDIPAKWQIEYRQ